MGASAVLRAPYHRALRALDSVRVRTRRHAVFPNSVLHISYLVHIPRYTTRILRAAGMRADYLAVGPGSPAWSDADYRFEARTARQELEFFWDVVARYEIIHSHFGLMLTSSGWELPVLKRLGRKIVVHFRGCEARDREKNMALHPRLNICTECDYEARACRGPAARVARARRYGDCFLVTTPDLLDFQPDAIHFPFFAPPVEVPTPPPSPGRPFRVAHATNHPGIEGTRHIVAAVERLAAKGHAIELVHLSGASPEVVLEAFAGADLTVGKLKMGYYANAQIESLAAGVPAVCFVRPELRTPELEESGLILTELEHLEETLERYLRHPEALAEKRARARATVARLHDNARLAEWLRAIYGALKLGRPVPRTADEALAGSRA